MNRINNNDENIIVKTATWDRNFTQPLSYWGYCHEVYKFPNVNCLEELAARKHSIIKILLLSKVFYPHFIILCMLDVPLFIDLIVREEKFILQNCINEWLMQMAINWLVQWSQIAVTSVARWGIMVEKHVCPKQDGRQLNASLSTSALTVIFYKISERLVEQTVLHVAILRKSLWKTGDTSARNTFSWDAVKVSIERHNIV